MSVIVANKLSHTDGSAHNMLLQVNSPLPLVLITRPGDFEFNDSLNSIKDYILVDFCEYGHDFSFPETHLFGFNTDLFGSSFRGDEWKKFDDWVKRNPPKVYFKREIFNDSVGDMAVPIEYPAMYYVPPIESKEAFNSRPLEVFFSWGFSSELRRQLHGEIWKRAKDFDYMVNDNLYYLKAFLEKEENPRKWLTCCIPWYARHPMPEIIGVNALAKISISHQGAGKKCFRSSESTLNSLMAHPKDNLRWSYPWDDTNSIRFEIGREVETIVEALRGEDLYEKYVLGVSNAKNYVLQTYIQNHIEKTITERT